MSPSIAVGRVPTFMIDSPPSFEEATRTMSLTSALIGARDRFVHKGRSRLRKRAIGNAERHMALNGRTPESYTEDERETIVAEEELKLRERLKKGSLVAIAIALGIQ